MNQIVIRYREYWWFAPLGLIPIFFGIVAFSTNLSWLLCVLMVVSGILCCALNAREAMRVDIISSDGINMKRPLKIRTIPWDQVTHAKIVGLRSDAYKPYEVIVFVFPGARLRKEKENPLLWLIRNEKNTLQLLYSEQLASLVEAYYGPLEKIETNCQTWTGQ